MPAANAECDAGPARGSNTATNIYSCWCQATRSRVALSSTRSPLAASLTFTPSALISDMRLLLASLLAVLFASAAQAQFDGPPIGPAFKAQRFNPANTIKLRLGLPVVAFGPSSIVGDVMPTFVCPVPGSSPCYTFNANQLPWQHAATTPTTGYSRTGSRLEPADSWSQLQFDASIGIVSYSSNWTAPFGSFPFTTTPPGQHQYAARLRQGDTRDARPAPRPINAARGRRRRLRSAALGILFVH